MAVLAGVHTETKPRVRLRGVVRSEWIKLGSVRSNVVTLLAAGAVLVLFGVLFSSLAGSETGPAPPPGLAGESDSVAVAYTGMNLAQLVLGVLGALVVTNEYATGLVRTMFAAVPRRLTVLRAKVAVVGSATLAVMSIASLATFLAAQAVYSGDMPTYGLGDPGVARAVLGKALYCAGVAVMGVALGFVLRSTAAAVATLVAGLMVAPGLASLLPGDIGDVVSKVLPSTAGSSFTALTTSPDALGVGGGFVVFALWVIGLVMLAGWLLHRRDA